MSGGHFDYIQHGLPEVIDKMFESPDLLEDIIKEGLSTLANEGRLSAPGVYSYIFDGQHKDDARLIAIAVREFNKGATL